MSVATASVIETTTSRRAAWSSPAWIRVNIPSGTVCVRPGMLPATTIVAPNSDSARTDPINMPASSPRYASGIVTVIKTRHGPAPRLRAASSNRGSTPSRATTNVLTISGRATIAEARDAANVVNARPSNGPRLPSSISSPYPITTGGNASGSDTTASIRNRPRICFRTSNQERPNPIGSAISIATVATRSERRTIVRSDDIGAKSIPHHGHSDADTKP